MAELVDALDSKSSSRKGVGVRFSPGAPFFRQFKPCPCCGLRSPLIFSNRKSDGRLRAEARIRDLAKPKSISRKSPRKRAPRGTGEQRIVDAATDFFAEDGFRAPTRELAKKLGVTQALIDRVFEEIVSQKWDEAEVERLLDTSSPLVRRLTTFYQDIVGRRSKQGVRLFMRAGLDDQQLAARYTFPLNERVLTPVVVALRQEAGLPLPPKKPVLRAERELVMMLHGAIAHMGMRKHIYDSPLPDDLSDLVAFNVESFLEGAVSRLKKLHAKPPKGRLGVRLSTRKNSPIE